MASSPVTAPSPDSSSSSSTPPSPPDKSSSPPPESSPKSSSSSPPPPPQKEASPPPPETTKTPSPPPPPPPSESTPSKESSPPPPTGQSTNTNQSPPAPSKDSPSTSTNDSPPSKDSPSSKSPPPPNDQSSPKNPSPASDNNHNPPSSSSSSSTPNNNVTPSPPQRSSSDSPTKALSQPSTHSGSSSSNHDSSSSTNDTLPIVVGVALGVVLLSVIMMATCCLCKKKKRPHDLQYYGGPAKAEYYNSTPSWNANRQSIDHIVKVPPPPGAMGPPGSGWGGPPPPPMMSSGEMSSQFSGPHGTALPPPSPNLALGFNKSTFTYDELAMATNGFSQANLLGQGGFGYVHKGVFSNGKEVAVKSLKSGSGQGEREFQAEVEIISRVHHRHLVSLVGYCIAGGQRMLVYEFVPNNTLEHHLYATSRPPMEWSVRHRIALGAAKGLAYLHEDCHPRIIHRDIKTANILLDYNFEAMVADFGLAKLSSDNYTHVSTRVMGTFGYMAPEYASSGKLTEKSDVFSYGVMLLELITGKRPIDTTNSYMEDSLVDWARPIMTQALADGNFEELIDSRLEKNYNPQEMAQMVACAAASIRHSARRRPKMSQIVRALEGDVSLEDLNEGVKPGQSTVFGTSGSDYEKFKKMALGSQDFSSSEFGNTSEYGLHPSSSSSNDSREMKEGGNRRQNL